MRKTFVSGFAQVDAKLVAFTVTDDGIVRTPHTLTPIEVDPTLPVFFTRGSIQSAGLKAGENRSDHIVASKVLAGGWRETPRTLADHIVHMAAFQPDPTKAATKLIVLVVSAYDEAYEKATAPAV